MVKGQYMTDRDALLAAIQLRPAEDVPRGAFADCIQEDEPDLADFIRAGVVASRYRDADVIDAQEYYDAQRVIHRLCEGGCPARWVSGLGIGPAPLTTGGWMWDCTVDRVTVRIGNALGTFTRGMLTELTVTLGEWADAAGRAMAGWPLERVTVSESPGLRFEVSPPFPLRPGWFVAGVLHVPQRRVRLVGGPVLDPGLAPYPMLVDPPEVWTAEAGFPDREGMVAGAAAASLRIADELRELAGDRWPTPPRR